MIHKSNCAKIQHYVPQFILRNFRAHGKKSHIYVFDKQTDKTMKTSIRNVASEKGFYDFKLNETNLSMESVLSKVETDVSPIIKSIAENESLALMTEEDRVTLSVFMAIQFLRTKRHRLLSKEINSSLERHFRKMGTDPNDVENFMVLNDNEIARSSTIDLMDNTPEFANHILDKIWLLFKTSGNNPFYISDNPITLQNNIARGVRGNLGLISKGVEIYFPISKTLTLGMLCRSYEDKLNDIEQKLEIFKGIVPKLKKQYSESEDIEQLIHGHKTGSSIEMRPEGVVNLNSLQVTFSSRFVYSSMDEFSLIRAMIKDDPKYRKGHTVSVQ